MFFRCPSERGDYALTVSLAGFLGSEAHLRFLTVIVNSLVNGEELIRFLGFFWEFRADISDWCTRELELALDALEELGDALARDILSVIPR